MRLPVTLAAILLAVTAAHAAKPEFSPAQSDSINVAAATVMSEAVNSSLNRLADIGLPVDKAVFLRALENVLTGADRTFTPATANDYLEACVRSIPTANAADPAREQAFIDSIAATPGAMRLPSGVVLVIRQEGEGMMPTAADRVTVAHVMRLSDGTVVDQSTLKEPVQFDVSKVPAGLSEGFRNMRPGGSYRVVVPAALGYGAHGIPGAIPGNAALDFDVTLMGIEKPN